MNMQGFLSVCNVKFKLCLTTHRLNVQLDIIIDHVVNRFHMVCRCVYTFNISLCWTVTAFVVISLQTTALCAFFMNGLMDQ